MHFAVISLIIAATPEAISVPAARLAPAQRVDSALWHYRRCIHMLCYKI